ncbi:hypothetical protein VQH23_01270 [Pararoseomonas sp. SCSIO 73927]|uniref:hypothetical protein n=1 Tax=Pararoseomonas sp. SCSIO 73927 TaxID=3114537 RepID=UPI0030D45D37
MVDASNGDKPTPRPGDVAPIGTPGTDEVPCQECQGAGELMGKPCIACNGTGVVVREKI